MIGAVHFRNDGSDRGVLLGLGILARFRFEIGGLKYGVRFMIAAAGIYRANDGELVHHGSLLGQVLAELDAWQFCRDHTKRTTVNQRSVGFGIPGIDMTGSAGHPQQDDTLARSDRFPRFGSGCTRLQQSRQRQTGQTGKSSLQHTAPIGHRQTFGRTSVKVRKGMAMRNGMSKLVHS